MKLLLIDGHYYVYRSFFAIRNLSNSRGEPTNAIYGFLKCVRKMLKDIEPDYAAVIWDQGLPERRTQLQPEYKQQRADMPSEMIPQIAAIQRLVPWMGLHGLSSPNTEADDLMASYTCAAVHEGIGVILATNDKDLFQLVDERVKVYTTAKADLPSSKETFALLDAEWVRRKWGVSPDQIGEVLCLIGDSVDNIPGVPGLGPKNAASILRETGGLTALVENVDLVKNLRLREKIAAARAQIAQNREMVKLDADLPLPLPVRELKVVPRFPELLAELERCEFKSLLQEVREEASRGERVEQRELLL